MYPQYSAVSLDTGMTHYLQLSGQKSPQGHVKRLHLQDISKQDHSIGLWIKIQPGTKKKKHTFGMKNIFPIFRLLAHCKLGIQSGQLL